MRFTAIISSLLYSTAVFGQVCGPLPSYVGTAFSPAPGSGPVFNSDTAGGNGYTIAHTAIGVLDSGSGSSNAWAHYALGINANSGMGNLLTEENSLLNKGSTTIEDPYTVPPLYTENLRIDCSNGTAANDCSSAIHILNNGASYVDGIIFSANALDTKKGYMEAIALPASSYIAWYASAGVLGAWFGYYPGVLTFQTNGVYAIHAGGGLNINGAAGVSCSGTPSSLFAVTDGIVTHC